MPPELYEKGPSESLLDASRQFVFAMEAVRDLAMNGASTLAQLDDKRHAFVREVAEQLPHESPDAIDEVFGVVEVGIKSLDDYIDSVGDLPDDTDDPEAVAQAQEVGRTMDKLFDEIDASVVEKLSDRSAARVVLRKWFEVEKRPSRLTIMRSALLMSAVSNFEVLIGKAIRWCVLSRPGIIKRSERSYTFSDVSSYSSLEEFREHCAEMYSEGVMRGGLDDWLLWLKENPHIGIEDVASEPDLLREIFQRRHLLVHNGGIVNRLYISKLPGRKDLPDLNKRLDVDEDYMNSAIDVLTIAGKLIAIKVLLKIEKPSDADGHEVFHDLANLSYELLCSRRFDAVVALASKMVDICTDEGTRLLLRVNAWVAVKAIHGVDAIRAEVQAWQTGVLQSNYRLARIALLDRHDEAADMVQGMLDADELTWMEWQTWPLLEDTRKFVATSAQHVSLQSQQGLACVATDTGETDMDR